MIAFWEVKVIVGLANDQKLPDSIVLLELNFYVQCFVDRLAIVLFVFRFTGSDYPFSIFKLFLQLV